MSRSPSTREIPPPLELLCLRALWTLEEGSVRDVQQAIAGARTLAYTTVMTLLERLARKGVVARRKSGRAFLYAPVASRDAMRRIALKEFIDCHFDGSQDQLLRFLQAAPPAAPLPLAAEPERLDAVLL
jgi:predicted transcriptional regulator